MAKLDISHLTVEQMEKELSRRRRALKTLERRRQKLASKLQTIDARIEELGGTALSGARVAKVAKKVKSVRRRAKNKQSLLEALKSAMAKGQAMTVPEILEAVRRVGYVSKSKTFRTIVYQTLGREKGTFKRVGHGKYAQN